MKTKMIIEFTTDFSLYKLTNANKLVEYLHKS